MIRRLACHGRAPQVFAPRPVRACVLGLKVNPRQSRCFWNVREELSEREEPTQETPTELSQRVKHVLRSVPHALAIIAATSTEEGSKPTGLLVSSFNSVTVYPIPYISFNIKLPSATLDAIKSSRNFTATIVDNPYAADAFSQQLPHSDELKLSMLRSNGMLQDGFGAVFWLRCRWSATDAIEVGDHAIVVGEVLNAGQYPGKDLAEGAMVYWQGHYTHIGPHRRHTKLGTSTPPQAYHGRFRKVTFPPKQRDTDTMKQESEGALRSHEEPK